MKTIIFPNKINGFLNRIWFLLWPQVTECTGGGQAVASVGGWQAVKPGPLSDTHHWHQHCQSHCLTRTRSLCASSLWILVHIIKILVIIRVVSISILHETSSTQQLWVILAENGSHDLLSQLVQITVHMCTLYTMLYSIDNGAAISSFLLPLSRRIQRHQMTFSPLKAE